MCETIQLKADVYCVERRRRETWKLPDSILGNYLIAKCGELSLSCAYLSSQLVTLIRSVLREAKLSLENDNNQLRRKNEQLTADLFQHQQQSHSTLQEKTQELNEVKSELKLKSFEWMNQSIALEVTTSKIKSERESC